MRRRCLEESSQLDWVVEPNYSRAVPLAIWNRWHNVRIEEILEV